MRPQTEELLYFLLWSAEQFMRPSWRNLNDSFESWAWRNGLDRRLAELARQKLIERHPEADLTRIVRLTQRGRLHALGGRDPEERWSLPWDGNWRLVLFDIPVVRGALRRQLLRLLHRSHFGCLQRSVWVSPHPTADVRSALGRSLVQADAFVIMEGRPAAGESDSDIVDGAWDFDLINRRYAQYLEMTRRPPATAASFVIWARRENQLWHSALELDPLLPERLLPRSYLGREAYQRRQKLFRLPPAAAK
jgi:phenylacetic acid degradation operon negative regulatory protein